MAESINPKDFPEYNDEDDDDDDDDDEDNEEYDNTDFNFLEKYDLKIEGTDKMPRSCTIFEGTWVHSKFE